MLDVGGYHVIIVIGTKWRSLLTEAKTNTTGRNIIFSFYSIVVFHRIVRGLREFRIDIRRMAIDIRRMAIERNWACMPRRGVFQQGIREVPAHLCLATKFFVFSTRFPYIFRRVQQNCRKWLLESSCLPAWNNSAPTGQISMKFDIPEFLRKMYRENSCLIKIWQE